MKKRFVGLLAVVLVLFGFTACGGAASGAAADKMEIAETMAVSPPAAAEDICRKLLLWKKQNGKREKR